MFRCPASSMRPTIAPGTTSARPRHCTVTEPATALSTTFPADWSSGRYSVSPASVPARAASFAAAICDCVRATFQRRKSSSVPTKFV